MTEIDQQAQGALKLPIAGAVIGAITYVIAIGVGSLLDISDGDQDTGTWIFTFIIAAVILGATLFAIQRVVGRGNGAMSTTALVFGILAFIGILVFWASPPLTFGGAAIGLGLAVNQSTGGFNGKTIVGAALGAIALIAGVVLCLVG